MTKVFEKLSAKKVFILFQRLDIVVRSNDKRIYRKSCFIKVEQYKSRYVSCKRNGLDFWDPTKKLNKNKTKKKITQAW